VTEGKPIPIPTADMETDQAMTGVEECNVNESNTLE